MLANGHSGERTRARPRSENGAVAVEFALIVPVLVMLLLGVLTAGIALSNGLGITNAVREGARFGATAPYPPPSPAVPSDWAPGVIARTRATQFDDPTNSSRVCVDLYQQGPPVTGIITSKCDPAVAPAGSPALPTFTAPAGTPTGGCVVRVWATREFTINALLVVWDNKWMSRQSIAIYERQPCG